MQKGSTLALKPRADITRSPKQEYQCPPKIKKQQQKKNPENLPKVARLLVKSCYDHFCSKQVDRDWSRPDTGVLDPQERPVLDRLRVPRLRVSVHSGFYLKQPDQRLTWTPLSPLKPI